MEWLLHQKGVTVPSDAPHWTERCGSVCPGQNLVNCFCNWWHLQLSIWQQLKVALYFLLGQSPSLPLHQNALALLPTLPETSPKSTANICTMGDTSHRLVRSLIIAFWGYSTPSNAALTRQYSSRRAGKGTKLPPCLSNSPSIFLLLSPLPSLCLEVNCCQVISHSLPTISITPKKVTIVWHAKCLKWSENHLHGWDYMGLYSSRMEVFQHIALGECTFPPCSKKRNYHHGSK